MSFTVEVAADPAYVSGLATLAVDALRAKRDQCQELENALSYVRRLVHGRLDIVRNELELRSAGSEPADLEAIIARLPALLAEGSRGSGLPRPPQDFAPGSIAEPLVEELETSFPVSVMASVPDLTIAELGDLAGRLTDHEQNVSDGRRQLHGVIDLLQGEMIRRYRSGDASVDSLLDS
jgi:hypothetical protein